MDWVKSKFNNYEPFVFRNGVWQKLEDVFIYWEGSTPPVVNEWYAFSGTTLIGLTAKLENNAPVYEPTYGYGQSEYDIPDTTTHINQASFIQYYDKGGSTVIYSRYPNNTLQAITLPDSMTELANQAFVGCLSFQRLNIIHNTLNRKIIVREAAFYGLNLGSGGLEIYFSCSQAEAENMFKFDDISLNFFVQKYLGVTTTEIYTGSTKNPVEINGVSVTAVSGDAVTYSSQWDTYNYAFDGNQWKLFDSEAFNVIQNATKYYNQTITND